MTERARAGSTPGTHTAVSPDAPGLRLSGISKVLGGRTIVHEMDMQVAQGEMLCLLGPSGCGKTTTLRMIGGFIKPDAGSVEIGGRNYTQASPDKRPTAMVFQNYALWPHMSVTANIAFGLKIRKLTKAQIREKVDWALDLVHLTHHRDSMPARISGGEQQRVALARALVLEPQVLLLDEPLSNLDAKLRVQVREQIREIQQRLGITTVFVTHDQDEALSVSDRVAVMNLGRIEQLATPAELYNSPRTAFVATFVGTMNSWTVSPVEGGVPLQNGGTLPVRELTAPSGDRVDVRPEDVHLNPLGTAGTVPAQVIRSIPRGHFREVVLDCSGTVVRSFTTLEPEEGSQVGIRADRALVYRDDRLQLAAVASDGAAAPSGSTAPSGSPAAAGSAGTSR